MNDESEVLYEKILFENEDKGFQLRLVINIFKDTEYIHIRKYFMSFDEGYVPSREGISMPASISNIFALLDALIEISSHEESSDVIAKYFEQKILDLNSKQ